MPIPWKEFVARFAADPILRITVVLILGVVFVNGFTDAPNAIATCVSSGAMELRAAIRLAAAGNLAGLVCMSFLSVKVAATVFHMADFGENPSIALTGLCAAMTAVILWAAAAWYFGIPTSESHALLAGLSGAAIAIRGNLSGMDPAEWKKVLTGLVLSLLLGFFLGFFAGKITGRSKKEDFFGKAQVFGAAAMAFMHGAQDGQKFLGVFLLGTCLVAGQPQKEFACIPFWMMVLCSLVMAAGTAVGGKRIIQTLGNDMVRLGKAQGFAADAAGALCLFLSSLCGFPVSTTHVKTAAMMGAGASMRPAAPIRPAAFGRPSPLTAPAAHRDGRTQNVNGRLVLRILAAWIFTFPGCGVIGYLTARIFYAIILKG